MPLVLSTKQKRFFNNGKFAYLKRLAIIGAIAGAIVTVFISYAVVKSHQTYSPDKPIVGKIFLSIAVPIVASAITGILVGFKAWTGLTFTVWKVIAQDLNFNQTTIQEIENRFGEPIKKETKNNAMYYYYHNTVEQQHQVKIKYVKFKFVNNIMVQYNK